jgi:hypothetical protein
MAGPDMAGPVTAGGDPAGWDVAGRAAGGHGAGGCDPAAGNRIAANMAAEDMVGWDRADAEIGCTDMNGDYPGAAVANRPPKRAAMTRSRRPLSVPWPSGARGPHGSSRRRDPADVSATQQGGTGMAADRWSWR